VTVGDLPLIGWTSCPIETGIIDPLYAGAADQADPGVFSPLFIGVGIAFPGVELLRCPFFQDNPLLLVSPAEGGISPALLERAILRLTSNRAPGIASRSTSEPTATTIGIMLLGWFVVFVPPGLPVVFVGGV